MTQRELYERFSQLHREEAPLLMPNAWDAGSARAFASAGFAALGSSSAAIAWAMGLEDGLRVVTRDEAIANAALLSSSSALPVNGDLEDGFGDMPEDCVTTVEAAIEAGLAGLGIEDTTADPRRPIHGFDDAVRRVAAAARAARGRILLTGRTDLMLHGAADLDEVIRRLVAFADIGADVLYAPGLASIEAVERVVAAVSPRPVNVLASAGLPAGLLGQAGVKRISMGGAPYRTAIAAAVDGAVSLRNAAAGAP